MSVFSVTGFNRCDELPPLTAWHRIGLRNWFHPLAWATWKDRWQTFRGRLHSAAAGWDVFLNWMFCAGEQPGALVEVYPELPRVQHIGLESSLHPHSPEWYRENYCVRHWAGNVDIHDGLFHLDPS